MYELRPVKSFTEFSAPLNVVKDEEASLERGVPMYRVMTSFKFYIGDRKNKTWAVVPEGFVSDGASVPKFLHWLIKPWGKHGQAAVLHDFLCDQCVVYVDGKSEQITYNRAHKIFKEALRVSRVSNFNIFLMYWAVRIRFFLGGYKVDKKLWSQNKKTFEDFINKLKGK